ncbi:MAG: LemA family protein [Frankiaceae bacterium]|nr:LemA family protein [Frankiaceae bacterium]MBV9872608.1 LemA family protein [Frankiaceae bacterium]
MSTDLSTSSRGRRRWLIPLIVVVVIGLVVVLPIVGSYNSLVNKDQAVDTQFANVQVQLQRRVDLIPNLSNSVKAALGQERAVFGEIAQARTQYGSAGSADAKVAAANRMESALSRLLVIVEQYPKLQSNQQIRDLMVELEGTENRIAQERRDYNVAVNDYNTSVRHFPGSITAGIFGFDRRPPFEATPGSQTPPTVDLEPSSPPASSG